MVGEVVSSLVITNGVENATFTVGASGGLTITPSGSLIDIKKPVRVDIGSATAFRVIDGATTVLTVNTDNPGVTVGGNLALNEITPAPNGVADQAILFAQDNGAGKTQLMVQFPTGAAQQVAIEA